MPPFYVPGNRQGWSGEWSKKGQGPLFHMSPDALVGGGPTHHGDKCSEPMKGGDRLREPREAFLGVGSPAWHLQGLSHGGARASIGRERRLWGDTCRAWSRAWRECVPGSSLTCSLLTGLSSPRSFICLCRASRRKAVSRQVKAAPDGHRGRGGRRRGGRPEHSAGARLSLP